MPNEESVVSHLKDKQDNNQTTDFCQDAVSQSQTEFSQESSVVTSRQRQEMVQALIRPHQKDQKAEMRLQKQTIEQFQGWQATLNDVVVEFDDFKTVQTKNYLSHQKWMGKIKELLNF